MQDETDQTTGAGPGGQTDVAGVDGAPLDLDGIERDLADVEVALGRLEAGTYWTDEATGEPLPEHLLEAHPTLRNA